MAVPEALLEVDDRERNQTDEKLDEGEQRAREQRLTLAMRAGKLAAWDYDVATGRNVWDDRLIDLLGLSGADHHPASDEWISVIHPDDRQRVEREFQAALADRAPYDTEFRVFRADGGIRWFHSAAHTVRDSHGEITRLVGIVQDVTGIRQTALELESANARLTEATRAGGLGIHEYYPQEGRLIWDAQMRTWWGLDPTEVVTYEKFVARLHVDDRQPTQAAVDRALDPLTGGRYEADYRVMQADASVRWMHATGRVFFEGGRAVLLIGTVQDVTEDRLLADALRAADQRKDVFLATLSHELRNPLAPIRTAARLLANPKLDAQQLAWAQAVIQRQVTSMALLLDDLLDISRITQGKLVLKLERVTLASVIDAAVESARPLLDRKQHRLTVSLPAEAVLLEADPLRLAQILSNLITNSAKYTDPGGKIDVSARVDHGMLAVDITDNGIGIPAEAIPKLFDMFSQFDTSTGRAEGGLGIGLALVKGLVELHGGSVTAHSAGREQGSTFTVMLPDARQVALSSMSEMAVSAAFSGARRVLLADDNRDGADALALLLKVSGHDVRVAYDGPSAVSLAQTFRPDVAIIDIDMPGMDGYAVARALRGESWATGLMLLAVTGWGQEGDRNRAASAGFDSHLTKPVDPEMLASMLSQGRRPS